MTKEELLKPRYKVIADYPGCNVEVGRVFESEVGEYYDKFPANFRRLEWWQDRNDILPGMFIRFGQLDHAHSYYKLIKFLEEEPSLWEMEGGRGGVENLRLFHFPLHNSIPATEEEYLNFVNSKR